MTNIEMIKKIIANLERDRKGRLVISEEEETLLNQILNQLILTPEIVEEYMSRTYPYYSQTRDGSDTYTYYSKIKHIKHVREYLGEQHDRNSSLLAIPALKSICDRLEREDKERKTTCTTVNNVNI